MTFKIRVERVYELALFGKTTLIQAIVGVCEEYLRLSFGPCMQNCRAPNVLDAVINSVAVKNCRAISFKIDYGESTLTV